MEERKMKQVFLQAWESMRKAVPASEHAQQFLKERAWNYKLLKIGYASKNTTQNIKKEDHSLFLEAGLFTKYNQHNRALLKDCIVFPLQDQKENITGFYGRNIKDAFNKHVFIREESGVYPGWPKPETEKLILTTSITDAASLLQLEFIRNGYSILAIHGFSGIKDIHKEAILSIDDLSQVFIISPDAFRQDEVIQAVQYLLPDVQLHSIDLPIGEDITSLLKQGETEKIKQLFQIAGKSDAVKKKIQQKQEVDTAEIQPGGEFITEEPLELFFKTDHTTYRILGGLSDALTSLKATVSIHHKERTLKFYQTRLDFYSHDEIQKESKKAAGKTGVDAFILETELTYLCVLLEKYRKEKGKSHTKIQARPLLAESSIAEAKHFLSEKGLFDAIDGIIKDCGVVGDDTARKLVFTLASSYKMPNPLHGIIVGDSSSGKTTLLHVVSSMMPKEDHVSFTRITENSLYNLDEYELDQKLLTIEDRAGLEEKTEYALRELQSKGELRSLVTVKSDTGDYGARTKTVRARIASLSCSTSADLVTDNENRCYMILVQPSELQTRLITEYQSKLFSAEIDTARQQQLKALIQNCMRILQPYEVVNPFAGKITLPEKVKNKHRLNQLYLSLVSQITLLHQFQRNKDSQGRLLTEIEDLELANKILFDAITMKADSLEDAILRDFYENLKQFIPENKKFTAREIYEGLHMSKTKVCEHLTRLTEAEFLLRDGSPNRGFTYTIKHRDNYKQLKEEIEQHFQGQIAALK